MAALVHSAETDPTSDVPIIKAVEIQAATHAEIIAVGHDVFKKNNDRQLELYNAKLMQHEIELRQQLEKERNAALIQLGVGHERNIENLKHQYHVMMNDALKEEADRVKDIMDKIAVTSLEEQRLEGQRMLDESLRKARVDFDNEKEEAVMQVTLEHEERQKEREKVLQAEHEVMVQKLNEEWEAKMKAQAEKNLLESHEMLDHQRDLAENRFTAHLEESLKQQMDHHAEETNKLNERIEHEHMKGARLQNKIQLLNATIDSMRMDLKNVLAAFQKFIDQSPGFSPGQSEFVLDNLIPPGFDEFISESN